jgi:cytochrome c-type biogenesis protein CcmH/NrfG
MEPAMQKLAWLLATDADDTLRNGAEAVLLALQATQRAPADVAAWDALAAAQAETGKYSEAVVAAGKALELAGSKKDLAKEIQTRLELYQIGKAYHQATLK